MQFPAQLLYLLVPRLQIAVARKGLLRIRQQFSPPAVQRACADAQIIGDSLGTEFTLFQQADGFGLEFACVDFAYLTHFRGPFSCSVIESYLNVQKNG